MRALGYARTSPGTNDEGTSLSGQKADIRKYCQEQEIELLGIFEDEDVSGRKTRPHEREGFGDLLAYAKKEEVDLIVVRKKNRISRETNVLVSLDMFFEAHMGRTIEIHSVVDQGPITGSSLEESDDPMEAMMGKMVTMMKDLFSEYEAVASARDTSVALQTKIENNEPVGKPTWGLTTNKNEHEDQDEATHFLPGDRFEDALAVLRTIEESGINPLEKEQSPSPYAIGQEFGIQGNTVRNIYRNKWKYLQAADNDEEEWDVPEICFVPKSSVPGKNS